MPCTVIYQGNHNGGLSDASSLTNECKPNCIYFVDDMFGPRIKDRGLGIVNLADGTMEHFHNRAMSSCKSLD